MRPTRSEYREHDSFLRRQRGYERTYQKQFYSWLMAVNKSIADWMEINDSLSPIVENFLHGNALDSIYRRLYTRITISEAKVSWGQQDPEGGTKDIIDTLASLFSGEGEPISLWRSLLNQFITVRIAARITEVERTTAKRIAKLIERGISDGLGGREVARTIREDTEFNRNRSLAIARTETITAMNQGKYLAAQSSPFVQEKKWIPVNDPRTRESHLEMLDSGWIPLDRPFTLINREGLPEEAQYPCAPTLSAGETVNCRCAMLTRPKRGENGRAIRKRLEDQLKAFTTTIETADGIYSGPRVYAKTWEEAERYVHDHMGYAKIDGEFVKEVSE